MTSLDLADLRQRLAASLAERGAFREPWLRPVFERVPRHLFVPDTVWQWADGRWRPLRCGEDPARWAELVYHPTDALVTQVDDGHPAEDGTGRTPSSSISSPGAVLNMLASLDPRPGHRTLEIGTGTGYNAALLCERVGQDNVVTIEVDPVLADQAAKRLAAAGYHPEVVCGDGEHGCPKRAPFDRLISTASVRRVPAAWLEQTALGGEIVTPWLPRPNAMGLMWLRVRQPGLATGWFHGTEAFMPVRGQRYDPVDVGEIWDATHEQAEHTEEDVNLSPLGNAHASLALGVLLPGVACYRQSDGWFLQAEGGQSWARADGRLVHRYGSRDLIDEACRALAWWREHGEPSLYDFGITVTAERQTVWLLEEDNPVPSLGPDKSGG